MCDESDDFEHRKGLTCWYFQNGLLRGILKAKKKLKIACKIFSPLLFSLLFFVFITLIKWKNFYHAV
jgi:hypothetical protein